MIYVYWLDLVIKIIIIFCGIDRLHPNALKNLVLLGEDLSFIHNMKRLKRILTLLIATFGVATVWAADNEEPVVKTEVIESFDRTQALVDQVSLLVPTASIAEAVVESCIKYTEDVNLCIKNVLGVANAESGMFKKSMTPTNNWFWFMERGRKKRFGSIEESISFWVKRYQDKQRYKRTNWASRLKGKYCASACTHRIGNYNDAIKKLWL